MTEDVHKSDIKEMAENGVRYIVGVITLGAIFAISVNIIAIIFWEPTTFQRFGSLWVATIVLIFGFGRLIVQGLKVVSEEPRELSVFTFFGSQNRLKRFFAPSDQAVETLNDPSEAERVRELLRLVENRFAVLVFPSEVLWLAIATLQWGFGDLFHCWINGNGWTTC